jgi:4-amino-4-deoxy-L-arabinose transferase-like glycosyltransferase
MIVTSLQDRLEASATERQQRQSAILTLIGLWIILFVTALFTPPLLDDADSTHANAARYISLSGDWVTLHVNGVRYLEKAPLPYWLVALSFKIFGFNTFATHLPQALGVLLLALLGYRWAGEAYGPRAAFYTGLASLTSVGIFLFTRIFIPEVLLSLLLCTSLYCLLQSLTPSSEHDKQAGVALGNLYPYAMWTALALAVLTKGLIAPVFFFGAAIAYLALSGDYKKWRALKPITGPLLFLAIAAPWHILAGLRNTGGMNGHGFFWFYFVNEHFLRFLGKRIPMDYNKLPGYLFWSLHIAWLFPWSLFAGLLLKSALTSVRRYTTILRASTFTDRTTLLLAIFSAVVLIFFSLSTNQEYYTFPAWPALFILIAGLLANTEERRGNDEGRPLLSLAWLTGAQALFAVVGVIVALLLGWALWESRNLPYVSDIGTLLAHRDVGGYTLSMSHFFDLTGPSFAALRLPASLAAITLLIGPAVSWWLRRKRKHLAATTTLALTSAVFLVAAHIAFARFEPMLSSKQLADTILAKGTPADTFIIYGDQSDASSVVFYTENFFHKPAEIVMQPCSRFGEGSSLLWGSCWPDAPKIFLNEDQLRREWGTGNRKWLFAQDTNQPKVQQLLAGRLYPVQSIADKALWTDRPLQ